jgi:hypothetical protein
VGEVDGTAVTETATSPVHKVTVRLWAGVIVATALAASWVVLAVINPTTTYHFDPLLVVIAPVAVTRLRSSGSLTWRTVAAGTGIGVGVAVSSTLLLDGVNALRGPSLFGSISPAVEAMIAILLGIAVEVASTIIRQRRGVR